MAQEPKEPTMAERWKDDEIKFTKVDNLKEHLAKLDKDPMAFFTKPPGVVDEEENAADGEGRED